VPPEPSETPSAPGTGAPPLEQRESHVANIKSQIKRNRQNERRRLKNKSVRSEMRTRTKTAVTAIEAGVDESVEAVRVAVRRIDRAAAKGVIHKNQAANRKSRLMRRAARGASEEPVSTKKSAGAKK
jgi:small subunit ribosomal protein S20